jgi:hypothetical protein
MNRFFRRSPSDVASRSSRLGSRRHQLLLVASLAACGAGLTFAITAGATLSGGSTFESGDGNLKVDTAGMADWNQPLPLFARPWPRGPGPTAALT